MFFPWYVLKFSPMLLLRGRKNLTCLRLLFMNWILSHKYFPRRISDLCGPTHTWVCTRNKRVRVCIIIWWMCRSQKIEFTTNLILYLRFQKFVNIDDNFNVRASRNNVHEMLCVVRENIKYGFELKWVRILY